MLRPKHDICIVGGAGHVGAPLAILLADRGLRTLIYDIDPAALSALAEGRMPFFDDGAEPLLARVRAAGTLSLTREVSGVASVPIVVVTIGTPVDEFHNPTLRVVTECIDQLLPHLSDEQTIILRSTVFPGVTDHVHNYLRAHGRSNGVAFCPERVVQGSATRELQLLPQIVSGTTAEAEETAAYLFGRIAPKIVRMVPKEAEFAKLFSNAYRYIQFAAANQFYMMVEAEGLDYARLLSGMKEDYPRLRDLSGPGFAAGPCLYKDTLQLAAFANSQFALGLAAINVNEGLPAFLIAQLQQRYDLNRLRVGLLGMAFKANSDDNRASLSYKLKKILRFAAREVITTDPYVRGDPDLVPVDEALVRSDLFILCVPHRAYAALDLRGKPVVDLWSFYATGPIFPEPRPAKEHIEPALAGAGDTHRVEMRT